MTLRGAELCDGRVHKDSIADVLQPHRMGVRSCEQLQSTGLSEGAKAPRVLNDAVVCAWLLLMLFGATMYSKGTRSMTTAAASRHPGARIVGTKADLSLRMPGGLY